MSLQVHCFDPVPLRDGRVVRRGPVQSPFFLNELYSLMAEVFVLKSDEQFECLLSSAITVTVAHFRHDPVFRLAVDLRHYVSFCSIRAITFASTEGRTPRST